MRVASRCRTSAAERVGSLVLNAHSASTVTALVLAGGRGSRMGGVDKGMQPFHGEPLALHVMRRIAPQADALLISANRSIEDYERLGAAFGARVIPDTRADYPGPLAGIAAALRAATTQYVLTAPCDAPFVDEHIGVTLMQALDAHGGDVAYAATIDASGQVMAHPVFALLRASLADDLDAWLDRGERKVRAWYARHKPVEVRFHDERAFYNINDLQQLAELERR
jgi:molybdopterin-guanine dinucleotide biosynthesis protein A